MDARDARIDDLIGDAIEECVAISAHAHEANAGFLSDRINDAITYLEKKRKEVLAGQLPRPSLGTGLGFSNAVGGWGYKHERLMGILYEIDRYYAEQCNCPRAGS